MDDKTAIAFAGHEFLKLHPQETCPEWLFRCSVISHHRDQQGLYIVSFSVTPIATGNAVTFFRVAVDPSTAETSVLVDQDPGSFVGKELQGTELNNDSPRPEGADG